MLIFILYVATIKMLKMKVTKLTERIKSDDCSGQFYWVDSVLVKALREGHWLLISNANFCRYVRVYVCRDCFCMFACICTCAFALLVHISCILCFYLCSASVLDRLNAVLEPGGVLTLDEKGAANGGGIPFIKPHPSFRWDKIVFMYTRLLPWATIVEMD